MLAGGVSRNSVLREPHPIYAAAVDGCRITDVDGNTYVDFANNMASLIHGHSHPVIVAAVTEQLARGTGFSMATEIEISYAEHLCGRNDGFEQLRFVNSGSEAVLTALKAARAFTGRSKIAKVEGAYHGVYDFAEVSQSASPETWGAAERPASVPVAHGTPTGVLDDVVVIPFNHPDRAVDILAEHSGELACVVVDVMPHRVGLMRADGHYLEALRRWTTDDGALLVADEVITFRTTYGGAQALYDVVPDLTALGKIIGGGFPVGAVAGRADVMSVMDPFGDNYRLPASGTFSANPVTMTAGLAAMELYDHAAVDHVNRLGELARSGLREAIAAGGHAASVTGEGSMFRVHMTADAPTTYREAYVDGATERRLNAFVDGMLGRGVLLFASGAGTISTPMGDAEVEQMVDAAEAALAGAAS